MEPQRSSPNVELKGGVPSEIGHVLGLLRQRIRRYVLIEGLSALLALLGLLFWLSLGADVAWFEISKLELPLWFRWTFGVLAVGLFVAVLLTWVLFRFFRRLRTKGLALVLERRFPQLDDRLVTAVEMASSPRVDAEGLGGAMLQRTMADAAGAARQLDLGSVFDSRPLRRMVIAASVLLASVLVFGVANANAMRRWYDAYIVGRENYWDPYRRSEMTVQVVAQPGDRVREFDAQSSYKHPRGADLTILVTVSEGKQVPESVTLRYRSFGPTGSASGSISMSRAGARQFRHTISRVIGDHQLWVVGGDFTNRTPLQIVVVEPPRVGRMELACDYPTYTGMDSLEDRPVVVQGTKVAVPMETRFVLRAVSNKPLRGIQLRSDRFVLSTGWNSGPGGPGASNSQLTLIGPDGASQSFPLASDVVSRLLPPGRATFEVPLHVSTHSEERLSQLAQQMSSAGGSQSLPVPFPLLPDSRLQLYLEDEDEVLAFDPATVTINAIPDTPPVVEVQLTGIAQRVTRLANIPVRGRLTDDYGVREGWFRWQVEGNEQAERVEFIHPPAGETEFELRRAPNEPLERFDLLKLQLAVGQKFSLAVMAKDGDDLNGPHEGQGQPFAFEIVSNEDLLGDLYDKEMNLRLRFEHIREEVDSLRTDLLNHRGLYTDGARKRAAPNADAAEIREQLRQIDIRVQACAVRSLHLLRKNHAETREVEVRFRDILDELVNNRVDTESSRTRLQRGIIAPLSVLTATEYPDIDVVLGLFGLAVERQESPTEEIDDAVARLDRMIAGMDAILAQMSERKDFNELIQDLQAILNEQRKVLEATERERQRSLIDDLFK